MVSAEFRSNTSTQVREMEMDFDAMRERAVNIVKEQAELEKEKSGLLAKLQAECSHNVVVQLHNTSGPIKRTCVYCTLTEDARKIGFRRLYHSLVAVSYRRKDDGKFFFFRNLQPLDELSDLMHR